MFLSDFSGRHYQPIYRVIVRFSHRDPWWIFWGWRKFYAGSRSAVVFWFGPWTGKFSLVGTDMATFIVGGGKVGLVEAQLVKQNGSRIWGMSDHFAFGPDNGKVGNDCPVKEGWPAPVNSNVLFFFFFLQARGLGNVNFSGLSPIVIKFCLYLS